ncbi:MAG: response regulator, partial [Rhodocyclaceae bacterium]
SWSFHVDTAVSGEEGLEKAFSAYVSGRPYELVLLDWRMPGADGVEVARRLREAETHCRDGHRQAIVIMVTAFGRTLAQEAAGDGDLDGFLDKPVIPSQLFDMVATLQHAGSRSPWSRRSAELRQCRERLRPIHGARVLLVEDNLTNQMIAREMLENCGLEVAVANDGEDAVQQASSPGFDAILMDIQMPGMDGHEATRRIRRLPRGQAVPIIAMTAAALRSDREASQASGMSDFIAKPIDIGDLASVLLRWISPGDDLRQGENRGGEVPETPPSGPSASRFTMLGLNLEEAASRLGDNWDLLRRALCRFGSDFAGSAVEIEELVADGRWSDARRLAHTVKGISLSIGAEALFEPACQLEEELAVERYDSLDRFGRALTDILAAISLVPDSPNRGPGTHDRQRMKSLLAEVLDCLKRSGFVPPETLDELDSQMGDGPARTLFGKLREKIEKFDYPAATGLLLQLAHISQVEPEG